MAANDWSVLAKIWWEELCYKKYRTGLAVKAFQSILNSPYYVSESTKSLPWLTLELGFNLNLPHTLMVGTQTLVFCYTFSLRLIELEYTLYKTDTSFRNSIDVGLIASAVKQRLQPTTEEINYMISWRLKWLG